MKKRIFSLFLVLLILAASLSGCESIRSYFDKDKEPQSNISLSDLPAYSGRAYVEINNNVPYFTEQEITDKSFESYSELDSLGRCGVAFASVGKDLMPTEDRGSIGMIKPTGWHTEKYDCVDGKYLYNRCHLIGFQLTGENANEKNLITGTRYLNIQGMLPFENMTADYVKETGNHVMYRVTPVYRENNLLSDGVLMEGLSVEDDGKGVSFCVFAYNVQPGVNIDYRSGRSSLGEIPDTASPDADKDSTEVSGTTAQEEQEYILNTSSKKFHRPDCSGAANIKDSNKKVYKGSREELIEQGYAPCGICNP